jgi:L-ascorbate metabolism protein UlaG (beta-lactamase superfamily)
MALPHGMEITWLGHATFRIKSSQGKLILTDPFISGNPATPEHLKDVRETNIILPSHGHSDNFADTERIAKESGATVVCIFEVSQYLGRHGVENVIGMNFGGTVEVDGITVTMVPAWHSTTIQEEDGSVIAAGMACGFVIRFEDGFTLYFSGDTGVFLDMQLIGKLYKPDLAILPIGDLFTMGPREAAEAIRLIGVKEVVPMHYGTFPMLTGTPDALLQETGDIQGLQIHAIQPGETLR